MVFCTLFNQYYLTRGLALYQSLKETCPEFKLYVFAFDDFTYAHIRQMNQPDLVAVSLEMFEDDALLKVKPTRSFAEYCWTSTPSTILWVLNNTEETSCTYVDADLYFYHNPQILLDEMTENEDVMITSHNYTPRYDQSALSGKYCVQFMFFRKTEKGLKVLNWWRDRCLEWCYNRHEDGKFGDQKYLDVWPEMFEGVHELEHAGALAPWNIQQFRLKDPVNKTMLNIKSGAISPAVFFHFHGVKYYANGKFIYAPRSYTLKPEIRRHFYEPYCEVLIQQQKTLHADGMGTQSGKQYFRDKWLKGHVANVKRNWGEWVLGRF